MFRRWLVSSISIIVLMLAGQALADATMILSKGSAEDQQKGGGRQRVNDSCLWCHGEITGTAARIEHHHYSKCVSCHTGAKGHRQSLARGESGLGSIALPQTKECLGCHKNDKKLMNWALTEHGRAKLNCRDCHGVHSPKEARQSALALPKSDRRSAVCMDCHQEVGKRPNMASHQLVKQGAMSCMNCHDPHGSARPPLASSRTGDAVAAMLSSPQQHACATQCPLKQRDHLKRCTPRRLVLGLSFMQMLS